MAAIEVVSKDIEGWSLVLRKAVRGVQAVVDGPQGLLHFLLKGVVRYDVDTGIILRGFSIGGCVTACLTGNLILLENALPGLFLFHRFFGRI